MSYPWNKKANTVQDVIYPLKLYTGQTIRLDCPNCGGNNTFSVTKKDGMYLYNCYRVHCKISGAITYSPSVKELKEKLVMSTTASNVVEENIEGKKVIVERKDAFVIPKYIDKGVGNSDCLAWLQSNQAFESYKKGFYEVYHDHKDNRIVIPLHNLARELVNMGGRVIHKNASPKFKLYSKAKAPPFVCGTGDSAVIVEDFASAASVARVNGVVGVALLGTNFNAEAHVPFLKKYRCLYIALDPDATKISMEIEKLLSCISLQEIRILFTKCDFKHFKKDEIVSFMEDNNVVAKGTTTVDKPEKKL